jgi:BirA family transcriptional regulator, biotin operon repressor / biotin---[acetyl-CoA-carboxylase] ligase
MKKIYFESLDSTNTYLKKNYANLDHMTWVSTDYQTNGKGRTHKNWYGDRYSLMCSLLLKTDIDLKDIIKLPLLAAMSLHKVLSKYHSTIKIKWPNDLLINHLKLSGILVESVIESKKPLAIIIGFGVNINQQVFNENIKDIATSLYLETNQTYDKTTIFNQLINQFDKDYHAFKLDQKIVIEYCNLHLAFKDHMISFIDQQDMIKAKIIKIDHNGHLLVKTKTKTMSLYSGEVTILKS